MNMSGQIVKSYSDEFLSFYRQLYYPCSIVIDSHDNILIANCFENRLVLFNLGADSQEVKSDISSGAAGLTGFSTASQHIVK